MNIEFFRIAGRYLDMKIDVAFDNEWDFIGHQFGYGKQRVY